MTREERRKKLLFVTELLPASRAGEITGGVEARAHYVIGALRERHDVSVVTQYTDGSRWDPASAESMPRRLRFVVRALFEGLRARFDVIEGSILVVFPVCWLIARLRRRPVVYWYPDVLIGQWRSAGFGVVGWVGEVFERLALKMRADRYIAITHSTARKLVAHGIPAELVTVVGCGFDPEVIEAARSSPAPRAHPTIVVVSRLVPYKRVDVVVRALARLVPTHGDLRLEVIGQGPERDALAALASELGVSDRVTFTGHVPSHLDVLRRVASAHALVSASEIEGFGIVLVEAMALKVPYVAADNDAYVEVTGGGEGGALFRQGDDEDLARRLEVLLDDPELHAETGARGAARAQRYRWLDVARATEEVLVGAARHYGL